MQILKCIPATKIPLPNEQALSYYASQKITRGSLVKAPLRGRDTPALVIEANSIKDKKLEIKQEEFQLKKISSVLTSKAVFSAEYIELLKWSSKYWWEPAGLFLKNALPEKKDFEFYQSLPAPDFSKNKKQESKKEFWFKDEMLKKLKKNLTEAQEKEKNTLVLVPELEKLDSLKKIIESWEIPFKLYSGQSTKGEKKGIWKQLLKNEPTLLIATMKALFLPWVDLDQIIITDEGNSHYKSWGRHPKYQGKHLAFKLAKLKNAKLILEGPAPSVQSYRKFKDLSSDFNSDNLDQNLKRTKTSFEFINRAEEEDWKDGKVEFSYISEKAQQALEKTLSDSKKNQILFLHPRRGSATAILCKDCGHIFSCSNCSVSFTYHRQNKEKKMVCHYCGKEETPPTTCSECGSHQLKYGGVGTQKLEKIIQKLYPDSRGLRMDSDTAPKEKQKKKIATRFKEKDVNYLVATQMVLSSSLDSFDLVFIPNLDLFLERPDFRAQERTLYLLKKLEAYSNSIVAQTFIKNQDFLKHYRDGNYTRFYKSELEKRGNFLYPPFTQLTKLETSAGQKKESLKQARILKKKIENYLERKKSDKIKVLGPSPEYPAEIRGKHRHKLILKVPRDKLSLRNRILAFVGPKWEVDVEPVQL